MTGKDQALACYPESPSGPRERMVAADCSICRATAVTNCEDCGGPICQECAISCAACKQDKPWCIRCAIKRGAFEQIDADWFCENHAAEFEPELEMERR